MSVATVLEKIEQKAEREVLAIRENGQRESDALRDSILARAKAQAAEIAAKAEKQADGIRSGEKLQAGLEARKRTLGAKREVLDEVYAKCHEQLLALTQEQWVRLMENAVLHSGLTGRIGVSLSAADYDRYHSLFEGSGSLCEAWGKKLSERSGTPCTLYLEGANDELDGGLFLTGDICDVDASLRTILNDLREETEAQTAAQLFN